MVHICHNDSIMSNKQRAAIGNQTGGRVLFFMHTDDFDSDYENISVEGN